jgi:WD repeat-containing protein 35
VLDAQDVYALVALATFYNKFYGQCSKAFVKLESLPTLRPDQRDAYGALAVNIFLQHPPVDTRVVKETREKKPGVAAVSDALEGLANTKEQVCVASGKLIGDSQWLKCRCAARLRGRCVCVCGGQPKGRWPPQWRRPRSERARKASRRPL